MITSQRASLIVRDIVGTSPYNPRPSPGGDLGGLKASIVARGVLQPLIVHAGDDDGTYLALDGSRRWHGMRQLRDEGAIDTHFDVPVNIVTGTEAELREIALAANVHRLDLHPVERFEAFAALVRAGMTIDEIARDFHLETRDVKKALALGALHEFVRNAWRDGTIDADQAAAFTVGTPAEQVQLLDTVAAHGLAPKEIRARLRGDAVPATDARALFARAEYLAAGGVIDESLFEEQSFFRDAALLDRVSKEKLQGIADRIANEEGWGVAAIDDIGFAAQGQVQPDYGDEGDRAAELAEAVFGLEGFDTVDEFEKARAELDAIEKRAAARAVPEAQRGQYGVLVEIDDAGVLAITRGLALARNAHAKTSEPASGGPAPSDSRGRGKGAAESEPAAPDSKRDGSKALRAVLDTAIETAFARAIERRPDVAIMLALAQLGAGGGELYGFRLVRVHAANEDDLFSRLAGRSFPDALAIVAAAGNTDSVTAFAKAVGLCVDVRDVPLARLEPIAKALCARGVSIGSELDAAFDRTVYFKAATKDAALAVIRELLGESAAAEAGTKSKAIVADEAARIATDRRWLPAPLSAWSAMVPNVGARSSGAQHEGDLAQAMSKAIDADADGRAVERFLIERTRRADGQMTRASKLHEAYVSWSVDEGLTHVLAMQAFGQLMTRLGHERQHRKDGSHYRGLVLVAAMQQAAE